MKLLKTFPLNSFSIELYSCSKNNLKRPFLENYPEITKYRLLLNSDSAVILQCEFEKEASKYFLLESSEEFDLVMSNFAS